MVQLILRLPAPPGGVRPLLRALRSIMRPAMSLAGVARCGLYADTSRPGALLYIEEWTATEDLHREMRSERFTRLLSAMEAAESKPDLEFRFISQVRGLEWAAAARGNVED